MSATPPTTRLTEVGSASRRRIPNIAETERTEPASRRARIQADHVAVPTRPKPEENQASSDEDHDFHVAEPRELRMFARGPRENPDPTERTGTQPQPACARRA